MSGRIPVCQCLHHNNMIKNRAYLDTKTWAAPAKQLLRRQTIMSSHGTDRVITRNDLCNNPCLVFVAPLPTTTGSGEDFQPPDWLRDSTMHRVHSKPNGQNKTEDSQISASSERWPQNTAYEISAVRNSLRPCARPSSLL